MKRESRELVYSTEYDLSEYKHVLTANKYRQLYDTLKFEKWHWNEPSSASRETLSLVHTEEYLNDFLNAKVTDQTQRAEVPIDNRIVQAAMTATQGTILAAELALKHGVASNLSGGFHHAFADHAEGFCFLNDTAIAIRYLRKKAPNLKVLVVDLDVHQGNGTAYILRSDKKSFTFSMHEKDNYPKKEKGSFDVELASHLGDTEYLKILDKSLETVKKKFLPELIFFIAGVDVYKDDALGGLGLTFDGIAERDRRVRAFLPDVPIAVLPAGGYARKIQDTVALHAQTIRILHGSLR